MDAHPTENMLTYIRIVIYCNYHYKRSIIVFLYCFWCVTRPSLHKKRLTGWRTVIIFTVLVALLDFTPLVFWPHAVASPYTWARLRHYLVHFLSVLLSGMFILWSGIH